MQTQKKSRMYSIHSLSYHAFNPKVMKKILRKELKESSQTASFGAALYLSGVLSYLTAEILTTAAEMAFSHQTRRKTIMPSTIREAICSDKELSQVFCVDLQMAENSTSRKQPPSTLSNNLVEIICSSSAAGNNMDFSDVQPLALVKQTIASTVDILVRMWAENVKL